MSYSFRARGATKAEVMEKVAEELDKLVISQPSHSVDREQTKASVEAYLGILADDVENRDFLVQVSASLSWVDDLVVTTASISISASLVAKEAAKKEVAEEQA